MAELALHPEARVEFQAAVAWYRRRDRRTAVRFAAAVERVFQEIRVQPDRFARHDDAFREALVSRFPYSIIYEVPETGPVIVVAIAHGSREPGYWRDRA